MKRFVLLLFLLIVGCAKNVATPEFRNPTVISNQKQEIVWVEPKIVHSDSLLTLIHAFRVDTIYVDKESSPEDKIKTTKLFHIEQPRCFTRVKLITATGEVRYILLEETLAMGYYQLSLNKIKISDNFLFLKDTFIKIEFCGSSIVEPLEY